MAARPGMSNSGTGLAVHKLLTDAKRSAAGEGLPGGFSDLCLVPGANP